MLKLVDQSCLAEEFRALETDKSKIRLAVAFWGKEAVGALGLDRDCDGVKILCNLQSGACNPSAIRELVADRKANVRTNARLHAKVYLTEKAVIVGSSNASANGLAYEGNELGGWLEANVLTDDQDFLATTSAWFDRIWDEPETIEIDVKSDMFKAAQTAWDNRRAQVPWSKKPISLFEACRSNAAKFRNVFLAIYDEPLDKAIESRRKEVARGKSRISDLPLALGNDLWAYQNWPEMPPGSWLIDVDVRPKRRKPRFWGYAKIHAPAVTEKLKHKSVVTYVTYAIRQSRRLKGIQVEGAETRLRLSENDEELIRLHINLLFKKPKNGSTVGGKLISLPDAVRMVDEAEERTRRGI